MLGRIVYKDWVYIRVIVNGVVVRGELKLAARSNAGQHNLRIL